MPRFNEFVAERAARHPKEQEPEEKPDADFWNPWDPSPPDKELDDWIITAMPRKPIVGIMERYRERIAQEKQKEDAAQEDQSEA